MRFMMAKLTQSTAFAPEPPHSPKVLGLNNRIRIKDLVARRKPEQCSSRCPRIRESVEDFISPRGQIRFMGPDQPFDPGKRIGC